MPINFPIDMIRDEFPATQRIENDQFVSYFDAPGGTQVAKSVVDAMATYMKNGVANLGGVSPTSRETAIIVNHAREHVANLMGSEKENIVFGANMTSLAFSLSHTLSRFWNDNDSVVITEMDHHANVDPWRLAAEAKGAQVQIIPVDTSTKTLNDENLDRIINQSTKLVAVGLASNAIGTVNDIRPILQRAKEVGAITVVDAVHAIPHFLIDFNQLGADIILGSAYKFFGPHIGFAAIQTSLLDSLIPFKVEPAPSQGPQRLETGTLNFEGLIGVTEAIKFIGQLGEGSDLRQTLTTAYQKLSLYEAYLADRLRKGLAEIDHVVLYEAGEDVLKTPTVAFRLTSMEANLASHYLAQDFAIHVEFGNFYAKNLLHALKVPNGELIRAGIAPYNTVEEIDRLVAAVRSLHGK